MTQLVAEPLIVGDEHNTARTLDRTEKLYNEIEAIGKDTIHLGDTFHTKEKVSSKTQNLIYKKLKESKLHHVYLVGNHDFHSLECQEHSLEMFKELPNVTIVDRPTTILIGESKALFMQYYHDLSKFKQDLARANQTLKGEAKILFLHQGFTGFDYGNGYIAVDELDTDTVKGFSRVISGHFHKYQAKGNLVYLGTPHSNDFGETDQIKYYGVLKGIDLELFETDFPRHLTLTLNCSKNEKPEILPGNFYRVYLTGRQEDIELFPKEKYPGVRFIDRPDVIGTSLEFTDKLSNEAKFQLWSKDRIDPATEKLGLEILTEVR